MPSALTTPSPAAAETLPPTLRANLEALALRSPAAAQAIAAAEPRQDLEWVDTPQGPVCLVQGRALGSRRRPAEEGERLAEEVDPKEAGVFGVLGFGCGHHVREVSRRAGSMAAVLVFEPDVALLRAVLERIDCAPWLRDGPVHLLIDPDDDSAISSAIQRYEALVALGVKIVEHPPSRARLGESAGAFAQALTRLTATVRTTVMTTMVQTEVTVRNNLLNLDHYLVGAQNSAGGVADLANLCQGRPAVVVSAGPSLTRTIDALAATGLRERCVIVAVQTALKPLLARGIRPHFVTSLDYHEIGRRFFEGLREEDVRGVTLVAEPKVSPTVPAIFPGPVRCPGESTLDALLGEELAGEHGALPSGSTVAHLAYYLARHLGCDPVILTGQDLGFTDGQYYGAGASIHETWACELNPFTTLEMFEWERIARNKRILRAVKDHQGRRLYSDEQMAAYLAHFERDFLQDSERGLRVVDATEGGAAKRHTDAMPLREALDAFAPPDAAPLPAIPMPEVRGSIDPALRARARRRIRSVRQDVGRMAALSRRTGDALDDLCAELGRDRPDTRRANKLIEETHRLRDEAHALEPAFDLVQGLNQTGAFRRARADRAIALETDLDANAKQRRRAQRDAENVRWLADSADALARMLDDALAALDGGAKRVHIAASPEQEPGTGRPGAAARVAGLLVEDLTTDDAALRAAVERLTRCQRLDRVVALTSDRSRAEQRLADTGAQVIEADLEQDLARIERIRRVRRFSLGAWRSGVAGLTCYDEHLPLRAAGEALERLGMDAALVVGADWRDLDPDLCARLIERHAEDPASRRIVFSQAPAGFAGCVIERGLLIDYAACIRDANPWASVGGALRYSPAKPAPDPIANAICVGVDPELRDRHPTPAPHLALELTTRRARRGGLRDAWLRLPPEPIDADAQNTIDLVRAVCASRPNACVTLAGRGDPMLHPDFDRIAQEILDPGCALHVRTDLAGAEDAPDRLLALAPDVVSVDLYAASRQGYEIATGADDYPLVTRRLDRLRQTRDNSCGLPRPWIVPRMTRCDALLEHIEGFYDGWLRVLACAAIDPVPPGARDERLQPLPLPRLARRRFAAATLCVSASGEIIDTHDDRCTGDPLRQADAEMIRQDWS